MKANLGLLGFLLLLSGGAAAKDAPSRDVAQIVVRLDQPRQPVADEPAFFLLQAQSVTAFVMAPR